MCGTRFLIPYLPPSHSQQPQPPTEQLEPPPPEVPSFLNVTDSDVTAADETVEVPHVASEPQQPRLLHIPCPQGHELETPEEMLGQDVICPLCGEQYNLQYKNSIEFKREQEAERERRERRESEVWFTRAIIAAAVVLLGLAILIIMAASS